MVFRNIQQPSVDLIFFLALAHIIIEQKKNQICIFATVEEKYIIKSAEYHGYTILTNVLPPRYTNVLLQCVHSLEEVYALRRGLSLINLYNRSSLEDICQMFIDVCIWFNKNKLLLYPTRLVEIFKKFFNGLLRQFRRHFIFLYTLQTSNKHLANTE